MNCICSGVAAGSRTVRLREHFQTGNAPNVICFFYIIIFDISICHNHLLRIHKGTSEKIHSPSLHPKFLESLSPSKHSAESNRTRLRRDAESAGGRGACGWPLPDREGMRKRISPALPSCQGRSLFWMTAQPGKLSWIIFMNRFTVSSMECSARHLRRPASATAEHSDSCAR